MDVAAIPTPSTAAMSSSKTTFTLGSCPRKTAEKNNTKIPYSIKKTLKNQNFFGGGGRNSPLLGQFYRNSIRKRFVVGLLFSVVPRQPLKCLKSKEIARTMMRKGTMTKGTMMRKGTMMTKGLGVDGKACLLPTVGIHPTRKRPSRVERSPSDEGDP